MQWYLMKLKCIDRAGDYNSKRVHDLMTQRFHIATIEYKLG